MSKSKALRLGENEPNAIHKMLVCKPSALGQIRDVGAAREKSLKTSAQCGLGIVIRQHILNTFFFKKKKGKKQSMRHCFILSFKT